MEHRTQFDISPYKLSGEEGTRGKMRSDFHLPSKSTNFSLVLQKRELERNTKGTGILQCLVSRPDYSI